MSQARANSEAYGALLLGKQLQQLLKNPVDGFSVGLLDDDDVYKWRVMIEGAQGTLYEGGLFPATLEFPPEYPNKPPVMTFTPAITHPNVYPDGRVCISILHEAKEDQFNEQELMIEKWRPVLGVEAILISVISMLAAPNLDSPANVDAAVLYKNDRKGYKKMVRRQVRQSLENL